MQTYTYKLGLPRLRELALAQLATDLLRLAQPRTRGRKHYAKEVDLAAIVTKQIAEAKL